MVTPTHATMTVRSVQGITRSIDLYLADVANDPVNFDGGNGAGAGTPTFWNMPFNGHIVDIAIDTGPTVVGRIQLIVNAVPVGNTFGIITHGSASIRPALSIPINAGSQISAKEITL